MSQIRSIEGAPAPEADALEGVPIGERVLAILAVAYRARRPLLLEGPTGIGKSQIVDQFAKSAGIQCQVLDLSLLEPPDLIGLPVLRDGRTHYAFPSELPIEGKGVLMLEELNRAEIPVMQPALQLLSARRLHSYELPAGWTCVAAINPEQADYQVNRLDLALRSRFLQVSVRAGREDWLRWAACQNLHPLVRKLVREHADIFASSAPRSWSSLSDVLKELSPSEIRERELVRVLARGYLPFAWAEVVIEALAGLPAVPELDHERLLDAGGERYLADLVQGLSKPNRSDALTLLAWQLRNGLGSERVARAIASNEFGLEALERLVAPLPGDLREQCLDGAVESPAALTWVPGLGVGALAPLVQAYSSSPARALVRGWRTSGLGHRARLLVRGVTHHLRQELSNGSEPARLHARVSGLTDLIEDVGRVHARELLDALHSLQPARGKSAR